MIYVFWMISGKVRLMRDLSIQSRVQAAELRGSGQIRRRDGIAASRGARGWRN